MNVCLAFCAMLAAMPVCMYVFQTWVQVIYSSHKVMEKHHGLDTPCE